MIATIFILTVIPVIVLGVTNVQTSQQAMYTMAVQDLEYITELKKNELNLIIEQHGDDAIEELDAATQDIHESYYSPNEQNGYGYILDKDGIAITHLNPDLIGYDTSGLEWSQHILSTKSGYYEYDWEGEMRVASFEELSNGWILAITLPLEDLYAPIQPVKNWILMISAIFGIASIFVAIFVASRFTNPISQLVRIMDTAKTGDFREVADYKAKDELGQLKDAYNTMSDAVRRMIEKVQDVTKQVVSLSQQLSASAKETTKASEQTASAATDISEASDVQMIRIEEVTAYTKEINEQIQSIATFIQQIESQAHDTTNYARNGTDLMSVMVDKIDDIAKKTSHTERVIHALESHSSSIEAITETIHNIAEKTNLLAINASIEASRAGESGQGFAVVAEEVRKLAEQSGESASEITDKINNIHTEIKGSVSAIQENNVAVQEGQKIVEETSKAFADIIRSIEQVNEDVQKVTQSTKTLSNQSHQLVGNIDDIKTSSLRIDQNIQHIASASEEQTATMQEVTSASEFLTKQTDILEEESNKFKT